MDAKFEAGINIAIKIPKNKYEKTVAFYKDILKLDVEEKADYQSYCFPNPRSKIREQCDMVRLCGQLYPFRNLVTTYRSQRRRSDKIFTIERSGNL